MHAGGAGGGTTSGGGAGDAGSSNGAGGGGSGGAGGSGDGGGGGAFASASASAFRESSIPGKPPTGKTASPATSTAISALGSSQSPSSRSLGTASASLSSSPAAPKPPLPGKPGGQSPGAASSSGSTRPRSGSESAVGLRSSGGGATGGIVARTRSSSSGSRRRGSSGGGSRRPSFGSAAAAGGRSSSSGGAAAAAAAGGTGVDLALSRAGLVAVLDLCVALHKFVNVELHSQGWYAVRVRVQPGPDAVCTTHTVVHHLQPGAAPHPQAELMGAAGRGVPRQDADSSSGGGAADAAAVVAARGAGWLVEEGGSSFRTAIFRIRYCYEEIRLQTAVLMRVVLTNLQALPSYSLSLEYELLFQETDPESPTLMPDEFILRPVARETVTLAGLAGGVAEYFGCTFSDEHFGLCSSGLFGGIAGFATKDIVEGPVHRMVSSNWLCHLVGDGRREPGLQYRPCPTNGAPIANGAPSAGGSYGGAAASHVASPVSARSTSSTSSSSSSRRPAAPARSSGGGAAAGGAAASGGWSPYVVHPQGSTGAGAGYVDAAAADLDLCDQELRKKVIRLLHQVVEAPCVKQGVSQIATEAERQDRLVAAYDLLAGCHSRSRDSLSSFLRKAPGECFAPQNLDVLRALLASASASGAAHGPAAAAALTTTSTPTSSPAVAGGDGRSAAAAASSPLRGTAHRGTAAAAGVPPPLGRLSFGSAAAAAGGAGSGCFESCLTEVMPGCEFREQLQMGMLPTTAAALQLMDGLLVGLSRDSRTDWAVLGWVMRTLPREMMRHLKLRWERSQPDAVMPFIVWDSSPGRDAIAALAAAHRQELRTPRFPLPVVQPSSLWGSPGEQPVLVVDDTQGVKWLEESDTYFGRDFRPRDETHVAIFVHGFQGASTDLCLVKAHLMLMYPYLECLSSKTNEGNTHDSLQEMGKRLAVEMAEVLAPYARSSRRPLRKISLVGHSIGNLILRAALTQPEVQPYKHMLWLYISVCGPHLGFLYGSNAVVDTGLMVLKSIGKGKCLHQLTFSDAPQLTDCYLYRLAQDCPLSVFKLVVLVSSPQDRYVPYHSSAITTCPQAERDSRRGRCYANMLRDLLAGVGQGTHVFRLAVDFSLKTKGFSFSKLVGRTAHIEFIESQLYVGLLMWGLVNRYTMLAPSPHSWL